MISLYHRAVCTAALLVVLSATSQSFLVDNLPPAETEPDPSFRLTATPSHVTRGITRDVTLLCEHDGNTTSVFLEISRIRIMKLTGEGWSLLAERTLRDETPIPDENVRETGRISDNIEDTYLEIRWIVATNDTFGTYKCDVIGIDKRLNIAAETTPKVKVIQQTMTSDYLLTLLLQTRKQLSAMKGDAHTRDDAAAWPQGNFALLQPRTGCPVDLAFIGGGASKVDFHTESSLGGINGNIHSQAMPLSTMKTVDGKDFLYTLRFCEARRSFSNVDWPEGHYCINQLHNQPCPHGFDEGAMVLTAEANNTRKDGRGNVGRFNKHGDLLLQFCCKDNGSPGLKIHLPNRSPFLLYRKGGACQPVYGMNVSEEIISIDTEDDDNRDAWSSATPDLFTLSIPLLVDPVGFHLCYYTPDM